MWYNREGKEQFDSCEFYYWMGGRMCVEAEADAGDDRIAQLNSVLFEWNINNPRTGLTTCASQHQWLGNSCYYAVMLGCLTVTRSTAQDFTCVKRRLRHLLMLRLLLAMRCRKMLANFIYLIKGFF